MLSHTHVLHIYPEYYNVKQLDVTCLFNLYLFEKFFKIFIITIPFFLLNNYTSIMIQGRYNHLNYYSTEYFQWIIPYTEMLRLKMFIKITQQGQLHYYGKEIMHILNVSGLRLLIQKIYVIHMCSEDIFIVTFY